MPGVSPLSIITVLLTKIAINKEEYVETLGKIKKETTNVFKTLYEAGKKSFDNIVPHSNILKSIKALNNIPGLEGLFTSPVEAIPKAISKIAPRIKSEFITAWGDPINYVTRRIEQFGKNTQEVFSKTFKDTVFADFSTNVTKVFKKLPEMFSNIRSGDFKKVFVDMREDVASVMSSFKSDDANGFFDSLMSSVTNISKDGEKSMRNFISSTVSQFKKIEGLTPTIEHLEKSFYKLWNPDLSVAENMVRVKQQLYRTGQNLVSSLSKELEGNKKNSVAQNVARKALKTTLDAAQSLNAIYKQGHKVMGTTGEGLKAVGKETLSVAKNFLLAEGASAKFGAALSGASKVLGVGLKEGLKIGKAGLGLFRTVLSTTAGAALATAAAVAALVTVLVAMAGVGISRAQKVAAAMRQLDVAVTTFGENSEAAMSQSSTAIQRWAGASGESIGKVATRYEKLIYTFGNVAEPTAIIELATRLKAIDQNKSLDSLTASLSKLRTGSSLTDKELHQLGLSFRDMEAAGFDGAKLFDQLRNSSEDYASRLDDVGASSRAWNKVGKELGDTFAPVVPLLRSVGIAVSEVAALLTYGFVKAIDVGVVKPLMIMGEAVIGVGQTVYDIGAVAIEGVGKMVSAVIGAVDSGTGGMITAAVDFAKGIKRIPAAIDEAAAAAVSKAAKFAKFIGATGLSKYLKGASEQLTKYSKNIDETGKAISNATSGDGSAKLQKGGDDITRAFANRLKYLSELRIISLDDQKKFVDGVQLHSLKTEAVLKQSLETINNYFTALAAVTRAKQATILSIESVTGKVLLAEREANAAAELSRVQSEYDKALEYAQIFQKRKIKDAKDNGVLLTQAEIESYNPEKTKEVVLAREKLLQASNNRILASRKNLSDALAAEVELASAKFAKLSAFNPPSLQALEDYYTVRATALKEEYEAAEGNVRLREQLSVKIVQLDAEHTKAVTDNYLAREAVAIKARTTELTIAKNFYGGLEAAQSESLALRLNKLRETAGLTLRFSRQQQEAVISYYGEAGAAALEYQGIAESAYRGITESAQVLYEAEAAYSGASGTKRIALLEAQIDSVQKLAELYKGNEVKTRALAIEELNLGSAVIKAYDTKAKNLKNRFAEVEDQSRRIALINAATDIERQDIAINTLRANLALSEHSLSISRKTGKAQLAIEAKVNSDRIALAEATKNKIDIVVGRIMSGQYNVAKVAMSKRNEALVSSYLGGMTRANDESVKDFRARVGAMAGRADVQRLIAGLNPEANARIAAQLRKTLGESEGISDKLDKKTKDSVAKQRDALGDMEAKSLALAESTDKTKESMSGLEKTVKKLDTGIAKAAKNGLVVANLNLKTAELMYEQIKGGLGNATAAGASAGPQRPDIKELRLPIQPTSPTQITVVESDVADKPVEDIPEKKDTQTKTEKQDIKEDVVVKDTQTKTEKQDIKQDIKEDVVVKDTQTKTEKQDVVVKDTQTKQEGSPQTITKQEDTGVGWFDNQVKLLVDRYNKEQSTPGAKEWSKEASKERAEQQVASLEAAAKLAKERKEKTADAQLSVVKGLKEGINPPPPKPEEKSAAGGLLSGLNKVASAIKELAASITGIGGTDAASVVNKILTPEFLEKIMLGLSVELQKEV